MKFDLIEIANIPYRNHKAEIYSAKVRKNYKRKDSCATWKQSKKRIHRIWQEKPCFYYYLLCKGSLEEQNLINLRLGEECNDKLFEKEYC